MRIDECYQLGYVIKKHGLKGEVNVILDVDDPSEYLKLESVFVEINKKLVPFFIESIQLRGNKAVVKFEDVDTADRADELRHNTLYLPLSMLPDLTDDQFYYHEIVGYEVIDSKHGAIGEVKDVFTSSKQDLLAVEYKGKEILVPVNRDIIKRINKKGKRLEVSLPEGLVEIYL